MLLNFYKSILSMSLIAASVIAILSCEVIDDNLDRHVNPETRENVRLDQVAEILSEIPLSAEHLEEVYSAVSASSENGYDEEYEMTSFDYCPYPWIEEDAVKGAEIKLVDGKYRVEITLVAEGATFDDPVPYYNAVYAVNYVDCTNSGLEDYFITDSSVYYSGTKISAIITTDGYLEFIEIEIPFEIDMDLEHYEEYLYLSATETGRIMDSYTFEF